jgi:hypothetical protein
VKHGSVVAGIKFKQPEFNRREIGKYWKPKCANRRPCYFGADLFL